MSATVDHLPHIAEAALWLGVGVVFLAAGLLISWANGYLPGARRPRAGRKLFFVIVGVAVVGSFIRAPLETLAALSGV